MKNITKTLIVRSVLRSASVFFWPYLCFRTLFLTCLFSVLALLQAGQPQPVSGNLTAGQNYTIPTGKIFLLDCLSFSAFGMQAQVGGGYIWGPDGSGGMKTITFPRPLKLVAGSIIQNTASSGSLSYYGALIDTADFYVMAPAIFDSVSKTNGSLQATLSINDKAPAIVRLEKSDDLKNWLSDTNFPSKPKGNETNVVLNINANQSTNAFFRARVVRSE